LPHSASFDLDFHSVPANSAEEPLEKHYVSSRSRSQKGILVFLARDAEQRVLRYANAGVTKAEQTGEILQFVRFWKKHTGKPPSELVFDSQLTEPLWVTHTELTKGPGHPFYEKVSQFLDAEKSMSSRS